jgi:hypothetical protein
MVTEDELRALGAEVLDLRYPSVLKWRGTCFVIAIYNLIDTCFRQDIPCRCHDPV